MRTQRLLRVGAVLGAVTLLAAACGGSDDSGSDSGSATLGGSAFAGPVGDGEGALNVLAWPGYAEDGSTDPAIDWVTPFEKETGCEVNVKTFATSDEAVQLFNSGQYDVVSASGDASLRLVYGDKIAAGQHRPGAPTTPTSSPTSRTRPWNTVDGTNYGIPHGRGANLLLFNTAAYPTAPDTWAGMWESGLARQGQGDRRTTTRSTSPTRRST